MAKMAFEEVPPIPRIVGAARRDCSSTLTAARQIIRTIGYMSPEQIFGQEVDARCDLFAVGIHSAAQCHSALTTDKRPVHLPNQNPPERRSAKLGSEHRYPFRLRRH